MPAFPSTSAVPVRLGQTAALTGPLGEVGQALKHGANVGFTAVNAAGGVHGRPVELLTLDDANHPNRGVQNMRHLLEAERVFGLFGCMGTPIVEALLPFVANTDVPIFAPLTGAESVRNASVRNVLHLRPSYAEEAQRLVEHLATIGIERIGIAYQETTFGTEVSRAAWRAAKQRNRTPVALASVAESGHNAAAAADHLISRGAEAVLVGLAGKSMADFVRACRARSVGLSLYALSVMGSAATVRELGADAMGIAVSQVVPAPNNPAVPVVRRFLQDWSASGTRLEPSHIALEGYLSALVVGEVLGRAHAPLDRQGFLRTLWNSRPINLGGFLLSFDQPGRGASRFVELTMVGSGGRLVR